MAKFTYSSAFTLSENPLNPVVGSSSSPSFGASDDDLDDACSICLEPFTVQDPATVTSCKHEYHLQCILDWSQRSKECPICWQLFTLKDPAGQELLAAVEKERLLRSRKVSSASPRSIHHSLDDFHSDEEASQFSSFDEDFMRHLTEAAYRRGLLRRRESRRSSGLGSSNAPTMVSPADMANPDHNLGSISSNDSMANSAIPSTGSIQSPSNVYSDSSSAADGNNILRFFPGLSLSPSPKSPDSPEASSSLPETIKSKLAAASARYKESISKSKQGLKEKLLARNNSIKEMSKGVQREMNAGIAGVARMVERLDLASKRFGGSAPVSTATSGSRFSFSFKGKRAEENARVETPNRNNGDKAEIPELQGGQQIF
ncbi:PREDICTED: E3 ubiquitin-protein ligase RHF1A [Tarenaya hassleriana]|uniref:E3 ubiquitin-protein ligase RHF1A n=1 Tax=Tarenaya hassleriana TaxID=28532 RepID=UPI00053C79DC|nr:PREDICTED: E3 ubiquitin-protein ligase RHF1A [Tarenaya hassleriana]